MSQESRVPAAITGIDTAVAAFGRGGGLWGSVHRPSVFHRHLRESTMNVQRHVVIRHAKVFLGFGNALGPSVQDQRRSHLLC